MSSGRRGRASRAAGASAGENARARRPLSISSSAVLGGHVRRRAARPSRRAPAAPGRQELLGQLVRLAHQLAGAVIAVAVVRSGRRRRPRSRRSRRAAAPASAANALATAGRALTSTSQPAGDVSPRSRGRRTRCEAAARRAGPPALSVVLPGEQRLSRPGSTQTASSPPGGSTTSCTRPSSSPMYIAPALTSRAAPRTPGRSPPAAVERGGDRARSCRPRARRRGPPSGAPRRPARPPPSRRRPGGRRRAPPAARRTAPATASRSRADTGAPRAGATRSGTRRARGPAPSAFSRYSSTRAPTSRAARRRWCRRAAPRSPRAARGTTRARSA